MVRNGLLIALMVILSIAIPAMAGNIATCILDKVPGASNDVIAMAAYRTCNAEYPVGFFDVDVGEGRGFFGYSSGDECALKKGKDTTSHRAGYIILRACKCLYDKPAYKGEICAK